MAFLYLEEPVIASPKPFHSKIKTHIWATSVGVVGLLLIAVVVGISIFTYKFTKLKSKKKKRNSREVEKPSGPESLPMPVEEDDGVVRLDGIVSTSEI